MHRLRLQRRSLYKAAAREKNVAALSERLGQLQITGESVERTGFQVFHCEEAQPTWQSREGSYDFAGNALLSDHVLRDCHVPFGASQ